MVNTEQIAAVADVLEHLAAGRSLARSDLVSAALALDTLVKASPDQHCEILDAAAGLGLAPVNRLNIAGR